MKNAMKKVVALICVVTLLAGTTLLGFQVKKVQAAQTLDSFITLTGDDYGYVKSGQTMTLETADPTGCAMTGCELGSHRRGPASTTSYMNNTVLDVDITFSEHSDIEMHYGHKDYFIGGYGIVLATKIEGGNRFIEVRDLDNVTIGTITEEKAGTQLLGKKFRLQLSVQLLGDDIKLGVWINGTLYQNEYFVMEGMASRLNNYFNFIAYEAGSTVTMSEHVEEQQPEILDPTLTKLTLDDFTGMGYGTYTGTTHGQHMAQGIYSGSLDGTVCDMDVTVHTDGGVELRYGGKGSQLGLQFMFWGDDKFSVVADTWGISRDDFAHHISASETGVGDIFYNIKFNLKVSMQYVGNDANGDGILDDLKLGIWFNDNLYKNEYMIIPNGTQYVGGYFDVVCNAGGSITLSPVESDSNDEPSETLDPTLTKLTPADFTGMGYATYTGTSYGDHKGQGIYNGSLDGTVCDMDVTVHTDGGLELRYGGKSSQLGLQLMFWSDDKFSVVADTWGLSRNDFAYHITASDAGVGDTFINNKFNFKVSMQYVGNDANGDGILDDLKVGFWFNNKLCQNEYIIIANGTQYIGGYFDVVCNAGGSVTLSPVQSNSNDGPLETLDPTLKEIRLTDFGKGISYGTYLADQLGQGLAFGKYNGSLDGTVLNVNVIQNYDGIAIYYGGVDQAKGLWFGCQSDGRMFLVDDPWDDGDGRSFTYYYNPIDAGIGKTFIGAKFNLKISTQFVGEDSDHDGKPDDVKLGVWFNNKLYNNEYVSIPGGAKYIGSHLDIYGNTDASITLLEPIQILDSTLQELEVTDFGYTDGQVMTLENDSSNEVVLSGSGFDKKYGTKSLDGTVLNTDVTFSKKHAINMYYGNTENSASGLKFTTGTDNGNYITLEAVGYGKLCDITEAIAKTSLLGKRFNLKISTQFVGEDADSDGKLDDVKFGVWINNVLYNDEYFVIPGYAAQLSNGLYFSGYLGGSSVTVANYTEPDGEQPKYNVPAELDSSLKVVTLTDFGLPNMTFKAAFDEQGMSKLVGVGDLLSTFDGKVISIDVTFSETTSMSVAFGGLSSYWDGICLSSAIDDKGKGVLRYTIDGDDYGMFTEEIAKTKLLGKKYNLKLSVQYIDLDGDQIKDDVKLGVWFNNILYNNQYIYLKGYALKLGSKLGVYGSNEGASLTMTAIPIDYTLFGLTENWEKTLFANQIGLETIVGGSRTPIPSTGDSKDFANPLRLAGISLVTILLCGGYMLLKRRKDAE